MSISSLPKRLGHTRTELIVGAVPAGLVYPSGDADANADEDADADADVDDADATFFPLLLKGSPPLELAAHSPTPCELLRVILNEKWFQLPESPL